MTTTVATTPKAEQLLVAYLTSRGIADGNVSTELPSGLTSTSRHLKLTRIGGAPEPDHLHAATDRPTIQFDAYGSDPDDAHQVAADTIRALRLLAGTTHELGIVTFATPTLGLTWSPDPATDHARYLFGYRITIRTRRTTLAWADLLDWSYAYDLADPGLTTDVDPGDGSLVGWAPADPNFRGPTGITLIPNRGDTAGSDADLLADPGWLATWANVAVPAPTLLTADQQIDRLGDTIFARRRCAWSAGFAMLTSTPKAAFDWAPEDNYPAEFLNGGVGHQPPYTIAMIAARIEAGGGLSTHQVIGTFRDVGDGPTMIVGPAEDPPLAAVFGGDALGIIDSAGHDRIDFAPHLWLFEVPPEGESGSVWVDGELVLEWTNPGGLEPLHHLTGPTGFLGDVGSYWTCWGVRTGTAPSAAERAALVDWFLASCVDGRRRSFYRPGYRGSTLWP